MTDNHEGGRAIPIQIQGSFEIYPHFFDLMLMSIHKGMLEGGVDFFYLL